MENQHQKIKGYRDLSQEEIDLMNEIKAAGEQLGQLVIKLEMTFTIPSPIIEDDVCCTIDKRWVSIGKTHLQQGIMALVRSVAKPESF